MFNKLKFLLIRLECKLHVWVPIYAKRVPFLSRNYTELKLRRGQTGVDFAFVSSSMQILYQNLFKLFINIAKHCGRGMLIRAETWKPCKHKLPWTTVNDGNKNMMQPESLDWKAGQWCKHSSVRMAEKENRTLLKEKKNLL